MENMLAYQRVAATVRGITVHKVEYRPPAPKKERTRVGPKRSKVLKRLWAKETGKVDCSYKVWKRRNKRKAA